MYWFILTFLCGLAVGRRRWLPTAFLRRIGWLVLPCLVLLVFILGVQLGSNHALVRVLPSLGGQSLVICCFAMAGSGLVAWLTYSWLWPREQSTASRPTTTNPERTALPQSPQALVPKLPGVILLMVCLGAVIGWFRPHYGAFPPLLQNAVFALMLLGIGLEIGTDPRFWSHLRHASWRMFVFPFTCVLGSLLGGISATFVVHTSLPDTIAAALGCGWYSLAAVLVNQVAGPAAGTIAFLSNVIREVLCFVVIPILTRRSWLAPAIAVGGATTMDTTLVLFTRNGTSQLGLLYAFVNGVIVSAFVPIVIPLVLRSIP